MNENNAPPTVSDLYQLLFQAATGVKDGTLDVEKAKAISSLGQVMVNLSHAEIKNAEANQGKGGSFLNGPEALPPGVTHITRHTIT